MKFLCKGYPSLMLLVVSISTTLFLRLNPVVATTEEGLKWLYDNSKKPGVITLPSGLQYKVLKKGTGTLHPAVSSPCSCHYSGKLTDGTKFDSSYDRGEPTTFAPNQVIKGWTEAMQLMVEGDKWELYIPAELGYGEHGSPPKIPGGSVLVFEMELMQILDTSKAVPAIVCDAATKEGCNEKELAYLDKVGGGKWDQVKIKAEAQRLNGILAKEGKSMKSDLSEWMKRRIKLLDQLVSSDDEL